MYFLNFLDRNAMVNGKLDGLADDLKLKGTEYNTCVSILFVGYAIKIWYNDNECTADIDSSYLCGQIPSNMLLNRVRPSLFMAGMSSRFLGRSNRPYPVLHLLHRFMPLIQLLTIPRCHDGMVSM